MTTLKAWCESKWEGPMLNIDHGNVFTQEGANIRIRGGSARNPQPDKETKRRRAGLAMYNEKLRPIVLAEATATPRNMEIAIIDKYGRPVKNGNVVQTEVKLLNEYRWPAQPKAEPVAAIPRKRVPKAKLEQAAAIIAKVPQDELAAFLAKFGLSMSLAASIASLDNAEMIARQFLRATL